MRKILWQHFFIAAGVLLLLVNPFGFWQCPLLRWTGLPCPTCGMTRSLRALLHLDFASSLALNPMTIPFCILVLLLVHTRKLGRYQKAARWSALLLLLFLLASWLHRLGGIVF